MPLQPRSLVNHFSVPPINGRFPPGLGVEMPKCTPRPIHQLSCTQGDWCEAPRIYENEVALKMLHLSFGFVFFKRHLLLSKVLGRESWNLNEHQLHNIVNRAVGIGQSPPPTPPWNTSCLPDLSLDCA